MLVKITGKELKTTDSIKAYVEKKMGRIGKYFEGDIDVLVTVKKEKKVKIAEISVKTRNNTYRAVTENEDLYAAIDKNIDVLEGQIRKTKTKKEKVNRDDSLRIKEMMQQEEHEVEDEVLKTKYYELRPITIEDAKIKLEEKESKQFIVFVNAETNKVNVLYRLKDGKNFGIVEPE